jgi:hypothetical protein
VVQVDGDAVTFAGVQGVGYGSEEASGVCHHERMDKPVDASAELVTTPPAADMRYRDDTVTRVFVRIERADGRVREYEAREPENFQMNDPESFGSMSISPTRLSIGAGGGFVPLRQATPSLRLSFTANPRYNLHIRTERTAEPAESEPSAQPVVLQGSVSDETAGDAPIRPSPAVPLPELPA